MYKFIADVGAGEKIMSRRWDVSHTPYIGECGTLQMGKINGRMRFARTGGKWDWLQPFHLGRPQGSPVREVCRVRLSQLAG